MRKMAIVVALALLSLGLIGPPEHGSANDPTEWFLNGNGENGTYQIFSFGDDGLPRFATAVASPYGDLVHLAWPSAISIDGERWLFASGYDGSRWESVYLWKSTDAINYLPQGLAFTANADEAHGIGPTHVMYEPDKPEPFTIFYLVRGEGGPGSSIEVATSVDGTTWTRRGPVITQSLPQEVGGLTISYACQTADGDYALFYSGYSRDLTRAAALVATGASVTGPFGNKIVMFEGDDVSTTIDANAAENTGVIGPGVSLQIGMPHLIVDGNNVDGSPNEIVVPIQQEGSRVWFDRPLFFLHIDATIYSMAARKIEPSFALQHSNGRWDAIMTLYGPEPGIFAEYTTEAEAPSLVGPWTYKGTGLRFSPWLESTLFSTENPTPLSENARCAS